MASVGFVGTSAAAAAAQAELLRKHLPELLVEEAVAGEVERQIADEQKLGDHQAVLVEAWALARRPAPRAEHGLDHVEHENRKLANEEEDDHGDEHDGDAYAARLVANQGDLLVATVPLQAASLNTALLRRFLDAALVITFKKIIR